MMGDRGGQVSHLLVFLGLKERLENAESCWKSDHIASSKLFTSILPIFSLFKEKVLFYEIAEKFPYSLCLASL